MYPSKEFVLKAYRVLSSLSEDPGQQGATQKISAIRHLFALDAFLKQTGRQYCDSGVKSDKQGFAVRVADVVNVSNGFYTAAFYHPLTAHNGDCNTGSNFFSAGQVKASTINTQIDCPYPKRSGWPSLLSVRNGRISIFHDGRNSGYSNAKWYLHSGKYCAAFFVWLARDWGAFTTADSFVSELKAEALNRYSDEIIRNLFPPENDFASLVGVGTGLLSGVKPNIAELDIQNLFVVTESNQNKDGQMIIYSRQLITYGAPGTGKSFMVDGLTNNPAVAACVRTTFHPDSDYASFVGAYKPTMNAGKIEYSFRPQAFMNAYVKAWKLMANPSEDGKTENVVLVIEEINRGNCAQIFGDLFQLLDRDGQSGYSTYPIDADVDLAVWLGGQFGYIEDDENKNGLNVASRPSCLTQSDWNDVLKGKKLALPPNLYIWATMNTSDQSLFPIDSAFKRRWDWKYVPISRPDKSDDPNWKDRKIVANGKLYDWWDFIRIVNAHIADVTKSEDKQLGYFFVKATDDTGVITAERFANKVLFYLFNDVFKDWDLPVAIFERDSNSKKKFAFKDFFYDVPDANHVVGSVREDVVAAFIEKQEYEGEKVKADAPPSHGGETPDTPDPEFAPPPAQS